MSDTGKAEPAGVGWDGEWNDDKTVFTGIYTDHLGKTFIGTATWVTKHVITHRTPDDYVKVVEMPVEPHWEFTGEHECDPPPPDRGA
jgi:hypothetical protein